MVRPTITTKKLFGLTAGMRFLLLPALVLGAPTSSALAAEQSDGEADQNTDEGLMISVTASRVESAIKDSPVAVSVIDKEELDTVKFVDVRRELLKRIPGYSMIRNLRIPSGSKNYTVNLIDGLAISSPFGSGTISSPEDTNTFDIERVEVIRGPASALYGSNALGGVINVITRKPPLEPEYRVWAEGGQYDRQRAGVSAAGTHNAVGYFLDANVLDYEGWQDRTANERKQVSGKLLFELDPYSDLTVRAEYLDRYQENPGSLTQAQYDEDWQQAAIDDAYNDEQSTSGSFKYERDLSNHSGMELTYGIRQTDAEGPPSYSATGGFGSSDVTNQNLVGLYRSNFDFYRSQVIAGIDLQHSVSDSKTYAERTTDSAVAQQWDVTAQVASPFLQYEISPTEQMRVTLGARHDRIEYSADGYKVSRGTTTHYDESITFSHLSPKAGVTFDLDSSNSLWLGYGQGFVVPSKTYLFVGSQGYDPNPDLDPEKAENVELGLRGEVRRGSLRYDIALYRTDITDMLVADDVLKQYVNAGEVRVQGVETTLTFIPSDTWRFDLAYTYADNRYRDFVSGGTDYSGNTLSSSPKHHANTRLTWMPVGGLSAELEWNHISDYYTSDSNDDPEGKANRAELLNLRASYKQGAWTYWAHMLNVADKKYAERVSYSARGGRKFDVGGPRTLYAGLSYTWK